MKVITEPIVLGSVAADARERIAAVLRDEFGLDPIVSDIQRFQEDTVSAVYRCPLASGEAVVVKESMFVERPRALEKAYAVSEELRERGVPLPQVFCARDGMFLSRRGDKQCVAIAFVSGEHFAAREAEFAAAGRALGQFHAAGDQYLNSRPEEREAIAADIPVEKPYEESLRMYKDSLRAILIGQHDCAAPAVCAAVRENIGVIDEVIRFVDVSGVSAPTRSSGLLHNDFHTNNGLYHADGTFSAFLDIDQIGVGPYVWDLGNTLASLASNHVTRGGTDADFIPKARLFLRAYHKEHPLPKSEYLLILAATQRWDLMRVFRSLRRHHYEGNRLPGLLPKIEFRLIPRIIAAPRIFSFLTEEWINANLI